jgi:hypothetical protein
VQGGLSTSERHWIVATKDGKPRALTGTATKRERRGRALTYRPLRLEVKGLWGRSLPEQGPCRRPTQAWPFDSGNALLPLEPLLHIKIRFWGPIAPSGVTLHPM